MIFVTVGTHHQPFSRLLDALAGLGEAELVVQYGSGRRPDGAALAEPYMPFDQMLEHFTAAEQVITHAGVGSILCATRAGHKPLVVPRRHDLGEHVDEHQSELADALETHGTVIAVREVDHLAELLAAAPPRHEAPAPASLESLCKSVSAALLDGDSQARDS